MQQIEVELVTPEKLLFSSSAEIVILPGSEGDFGVLQGHSPVVSSLRPGKIVIQSDKYQDKSIFVTSGFVEINDQRCTILAEAAVDLNGLTLEKATRMKKEAEDALTYAPESANKKSLEQDFETARLLVDLLD